MPMDRKIMFSMHRGYLRYWFLLFMTGILVLQSFLVIGSDEGQQETDEISRLANEAKENCNVNPQKAKELIFRALARNEASENTMLLSQLYSTLGISYINIGQNDSALIYARLSSSIYKEDFGNILKFDINNLMGRLFHEFQQYDSALLFFEVARVLGQEQNSLTWLAAAYNNLGMVYDSKGDLSNAFDHYIEALRLFEQNEDLENAAIVLNNLGIINLNLKDFENSLEYFQRAVEINKKMDRFVDLSMNYNNMGTAYKELKRFDDALDAYGRSLKIAMENNLTRDQARVHLNMGNVHKAKGKDDLAEMSYRESLRLCEENELVYGVMLNNYSLGNLFLTTRDYVKSEKYYLQALQIALKAGHQTTVKDTYRDLSVVYENLGRFDQALQFNRKLMVLSDSLNDINHRGYVIDIQTRYETERKELENVSLRLENDNKSKTIRLQFYLTFFGGLTILLLTLLVIMIFISRQRVRRNSDRVSLLNDKYQQQNLILEETNSTKDKLFSVIAHDLRSPFSSMLGFLQLLSEDFDSMSDLEKKKVLESLFKQSSNTYNLIENLMTWAMNQRGQLQYQPGYHDLLDIITQEIEFLMSRAESKSILIENKVPEGMTIFIDMDMVRVIFRNLINNAIKFTEDNGKITIDCVDFPDELQVSIADTGRGMTPEEIDLVFHSNTFYSSQGTKDEKGTGLGLLIVRDFAEKNNIRLEVSSNPGKGSVFTLHIPVHE